MNKTNMNIELGNNETAGRSIVRNLDGTFTAVSWTASKTFKTKGGAVRWMTARVAR